MTLNEDLTKSTADLYQQARSLVNDKVLYVAGTADGALYYGVYRQLF